MPDIEVFDVNGDFTPAFKFKITEYLRTIPLSDTQVESITKALTMILKEALAIDAAKQREVIDKLLEPLKAKIEHLEVTVKAHEDQAYGMKRLASSIIVTITLLATLATIYQISKPDTNTIVLEQILRKLSNENTNTVPIADPNGVRR